MPLWKRHGNWSELTFSKKSGIVTGDTAVRCWPFFFAVLSYSPRILCERYQFKFSFLNNWRITNIFVKSLDNRSWQKTFIKSPDGLKPLEHCKRATCTLFNNFSFFSDIPFHYFKKGCWLYRGSSNRSGRLTLLADFSCLRISVLVPTDFPVKQTLGFDLEVVLLIPHCCL